MKAKDYDRKSNVASATLSATHFLTIGLDMLVSHWQTKCT